MNDYGDAAGPTAQRLHQLGLISGVGGPVSVDGRTWGALIVGSTGPEPMPPETEARVMDFADLVATAILNAETRAELTASRVRIVTAADQARRRFERDLHDGAQQRIVTLGLELRAIEASVPAENDGLHRQLGRSSMDCRVCTPTCRSVPGHPPGDPVAGWAGTGHQDPRPPVAHSG